MFLMKNNYKSREVNGSLTVEASLVLPIFIYAIITFIYIIQIFRIKEMLQNAITETGYFAAKYAYIYDYIKSGDFTENNEANSNEANSNGSNNENKKILGSVEVILARGIDSAFFKIKMQEYLNSEVINNSCIKNGMAGIHTYLSQFMIEEDAVDIVLFYEIKLPIPFYQINQIPVVQRIKMRGWTGHKVPMKVIAAEDSHENEEIVYITESGTVYHLSMDCTHLKLSIKEVSGNELYRLRNNSGGKYQKCILCGTLNDPSEYNTVYITNSGDRYHNRLECSGLKRTIITIPISEVADRKLCSRCQKQ